MKSFDQLLEEDIAVYEGRHDDLLYQAPAFYRLLVNLLDDPMLHGRLRPLVLATVAYFILPADVFPEDLHGPYGYVDDIFLCAFVVDHIRKELGEDILVENWDGESPLNQLIADVLSQQEDLIGEELNKILSYIGFSELLKV
jgi:uncharacterized membrane protein YkvA (DUF1232 family)